MCLNTVLRGKEKKAALAKLKDTVVVWKVLLKPDRNVDHYQTDERHFPVFAGEVKFKQSYLGMNDYCYRGGGHFWLTKVGAEYWKWFRNNKLVRCTVKKTDINAIGSQCGFPVVVVKKATFPKYIGKKKWNQ